MNVDAGRSWSEMKVGDKIRVLRIPDGLEDDERMQTKSLFGLCIGQVFPIVGIVPVPEINSELLELHVGSVVGQPAYMHSIWIERELVDVVEVSVAD
jgi:hypothetical protein